MTRPHPIPHILLTLLLLITPTAATARGGEDKRVKVQATETMHISEHDDFTLSEALRHCVELAKAKAIGDEFGTIIGSTEIIYDEDVDGMSKSTYRRNVLSRVRGLWIKDTHEPEISVTYEGGVLNFTATVSGEAEELVQRPVEGLKCEVCNGGDDYKNFHWKTSEDFHDGDIMGLKFKTVNESGYMAVYLLDWKTDRVQVILPADGSPCEQVQKGETRTWKPLPARGKNGKRGVIALTTDKPLDNSNLFVLFSPSRINSCTAMQQDQGELPHCSSQAFHDWLAHEMQKDEQLTLKDISLRIHGKR